MTNINDGGPAAAYLRADDIAEADEPDMTDTVDIVSFVFGVGCRLGVCLLDNFSASMENASPAKVVTVTTDTKNVDYANHNVVASNGRPSPSLDPNTNPSRGPSPSPNSSPSPIPCPTPSPDPNPSPNLSANPSPEKKEDAVIDYTKPMTRLAMIYELLDLCVLVAREEFGVAIDIGCLERPWESCAVVNVVTTSIFACRLGIQLRRWHKDLLRVLGLELKASVVGLRQVGRASGKIAVIALWATGSGVVQVAGFLIAKIAQRWEAVQRDNNTNNSDGKEPTPAPLPLASRLPVDQGSEVHCCTVDPQARKDMWVHAQYYEDIDGEAVPGVFVYLPVTVLRASFSEFSTDEGRNLYVQPGGRGGRKEWREEDGRVIWEVPQASIFGKVLAGPEESCDVCRRKERQCSWTPDRLECLCDYCADVPRRHLDGCRHARNLGFNWTRACDCLGQ